MVEILSGWKTWLIDVFIDSFLNSIWEAFATFITWMSGKVVALVAGLAMPSGVSMQFEGLAAWFSIRFKLAECLAVVMSMFMLKWLLRKIPFFKW